MKKYIAETIKAIRKKNEIKATLSDRKFYRI